MTGQKQRQALPQGDCSLLVSLPPTAPRSNSPREEWCHAAADLSEGRVESEGDFTGHCVPLGREQDGGWLSHGGGSHGEAVPESGCVVLRPRAVEGTPVPLAP